MDIMIKQNEYKMRTVNMALAAMGIGTLKQHVRISESKIACQGVVVVKLPFWGLWGKWDYCHWLFSRAQVNIHRPNTLFILKIVYRIPLQNAAGHNWSAGCLHSCYFSWHFILYWIILLCLVLDIFTSDSILLFDRYSSIMLYSSGHIFTTWWGIWCRIWWMATWTRRRPCYAIWRRSIELCTSQR